MLRGMLLVFSLAMGLLAPASGWTWGADGHKIVAYIAEKRMTPQARAELKAIMGNETLDASALWPDEIRSIKELDDFKPWHYATVPDNQIYQPDSAPKGEVVRAIEAMEGILSGELPQKGDDLHLQFFVDTIERLKGFTRPPNQQQKIYAIRFLAHFIGDIHQPLHVGNESDVGGNACLVKWMGALYREIPALAIEPQGQPRKVSYNLHGVWDYEMISKVIREMPKGADARAYADALNSRITAAQAATWLKSTAQGDWTKEVGVWTLESQDARMRIYPDGKQSYTPQTRPYCKRQDNPTIPESVMPDIDQTYVTAQKQLMETRLKQAGVRLAGVLNAVLTK